MFSNLSCNSISLATDTPSFVIVGAPNDLSSTTFLPLGPRVTLTAFASVFTPTTIFWRTSSPNLTSLAAIYIFSKFVCLFKFLLNDSHNIFFFHNKEFITINFYCLPSIFAEKYFVTHIYV